MCRLNCSVKKSRNIYVMFYVTGDVKGPEGIMGRVMTLCGSVALWVRTDMAADGLHLVVAFELFYIQV